MARAQDRNAGLQTGSQAAQQAGATTGPGTASGAVATGTAQDSGTTTTTTTGTRERSGSYQEYPSTTTTYQRGTQPGMGYQEGGERHEETGAGGVFAVVAGLLTFLWGLSMVVRRHFYHAATGYAYHFTVLGWGWILLVLGVLLFAAGATHMLGMSFGRLVGIGLAVLVAIAGFLSLIYTPVWGIIVVALAALAIWQMVRAGEREHRV